MDKVIGKIRGLKSAVVLLGLLVDTVFSTDTTLTFGKNHGKTSL